MQDRPDLLRLQLLLLLQLAAPTIEDVANATDIDQDAPG